VKVSYQVRTAATNRLVFISDDLAIAKREAQHRQERVGVDFKLFCVVEAEEEVVYTAVK
jgi:hypothetical protein